MSEHLVDDDDEDLDDPESEYFPEHDVDPAESGEDVELDPTGYDPASDPASTPTPIKPEEPTRDIPKLPVAKATIPGWVKDFGNGLVPPERMVKVAPIRNGYLVPEAARAWRRFQDAAKQAGFTLTMTGSFRTYDGQVRLFLSRFQETPTDRVSKTFQGKTYWLKPNVDEAATPGSSNHGWGCAVDMALDSYGKGQRAVRQSPSFLQWAIANAAAHGWSWELQSEPFHVRYVGGEEDPQGPAPVPATTQTTTPQPATPTDPTTIPATLPQPELKRGAQGPEVIKLQELCMARGWGKLEEATGLFGIRTKVAVKAMQRAIGAGVDGGYGPKTAAKLVEYIATHP
jgi:peptidoglycan hydrolase-like protein with peptidoglycan-binding domain